jgi:hypothetical protein
VDAARVVDVGGTPVVAVRSTDRLVGGVTLGSVHRVVDGGLQPVAPEELAAAINTATLNTAAPNSAVPPSGTSGRPDGAASDGSPTPGPWN